MKKTRFLSFVLLACLLAAVFVFCLPAEVKAETEGNYTYTVTDGKATVTGCQTSVSDHIYVPEKLGGYPVTTIGANAFKDCNRVEVITLSEGITTIEANAFLNCTALTKLNIPNSIEYIADSAFSNCNSLSYNVYDNGKYLGNSEERYIVLMDTVTSSITSCEIHENTKVIFHNAFFNCGLTNVTIPNGVKTIGEKAFFQCTRLKNISIPNSVTSIHTQAFGNCTSLANITIPGGVTVVGNKVFSQCKSLTAVTVPDGVTAIEKDAFFNCSKITDIVLPESLLSIGEGAFNGCTGLKNVYYMGTPEQWALIVGNSALQNAAISYNASGCIHKWDEGAVTKEADCVEPGTKTYTCTLCQEKRTEELPVLTTHTYQNDCDTECDICRAVREITHSYDAAWRADEAGHFYECTVCGDKKDIAAHTPGAAPTETAPQTCTVCGYVLAPALGAPDPTEPEPTEPEPTEPEPTEPEPTEPEPTEPEPTEPEPTEPEPTAPEPTQPQPGEDKGGDLIVTVIVVVAIVAAATLGIVEVAFLRKKKK